MRFSLHQQNCQPNSTAGRHKPGGINPAGASHPQLPKAQCARGPEMDHISPVGWRDGGMVTEHTLPEKPLWQRAQDTLYTTTVPPGRHTQRAKGWACTYRAAPNSATHKQHKGGHSSSATHCKRLDSFPASLPYPEVIKEGWQTSFTKFWGDVIWRHWEPASTPIFTS